MNSNKTVYVLAEGAIMVAAAIVLSFLEPVSYTHLRWHAISQGRRGERQREVRAADRER